MSNNDGTLTTEQNEKFLAWLNAKKKSAKCPVCQNFEWTIGEKLLEAPIHMPNIIGNRGDGYPQVFIVCNNCAYTIKFMAREIGLLES